MKRLNGYRDGCGERKRRRKIAQACKTRRFFSSASQRLSECGVRVDEWKAVINICVHLVSRAFSAVAHVAAMCPTDGQSDYFGNVRCAHWRMQGQHLSFHPSTNSWRMCVYFDRTHFPTWFAWERNFVSYFE